MQINLSFIFTYNVLVRLSANGNEDAAMFVRGVTKTLCWTAIKLRSGGLV
jgi:hypothetical protein